MAILEKKLPHPPNFLMTSFSHLPQKSPFLTIQASFYKKVVSSAKFYDDLF